MRRKSLILVSVILTICANTWCQSEIEIGLISSDEKSLLYEEDWFTKKYNRFSPQVNLLNELKGRLLSCKINVFMGTWCHDTKVYLPRFLKLFDTLNLPKDNIQIYNVNETKKRPRKYVKVFDVKYLPTVIFSDDNGEIGRIVEFPFETIEKDIVKIFSLHEK